MHNKKTLWVLCALLIALSPACKKGDAARREALLRDDLKLTENSQLVKELKNLTGSLKTAKDDVERSQIYSNISKIHIEKGDVASAMKSAREAVKYLPNQYLPHYLLGKSYLDAGRYDEAESEFLISIGYKSDYALSHYELANSYYKRMKYAEAVSEYRLAVRYDGSLYQAYNNMGVVLSLLGRNDEAISALAAGVKAKADFPVFYKNLGIVYDTRLKNGRLALENYRKYLELRPDCPERKSVEAWIAALGR